MKTSKLMILTAALVLAVPIFAQQIPTKEGVTESIKKQYSPYVGRSFPTTVYWGDLQRSRERQIAAWRQI